MKKHNTGNPLATLFYILLVCTVSMLIITACKKTDDIVKPETPKETIILEKFFSINLSTNPAVIGAQKFLKNQNDKYHFTEKFISRIGMPYWNKALVYNNTLNTTIRTETAEVPSTVVYIPFVRDSQNYVNASVLIRMTGTDTSYRIICDWQYSEFGFEHSDTSWSARDIFAIFSMLDKSVFGHKKYRIKDGRIFGYPRETPLIVTEVPQAGRIGTETFNLECTPHTVCVTAEPSTNRVSTETVCTTSYTCALVWTGGGSGPGPLPPGGGGGGGGGTGGPGDGGPVLPPNPCPVLPRGAYITETASNPCDTTTWIPVPDVNVDLENPCMDLAVNSVLGTTASNPFNSNAYFNLISGLLASNFSNSNALGHMNVIQGTIWQSDAQTIHNSDGSFTIKLDPTYWAGQYINGLPVNPSQEYWGATFIHELVHVFIIQENIGMSLATNGLAQHALMIQSWINSMSTLLQDIYGLSWADARGLALGGVGDVLNRGTYNISAAQWDLFIQQNYGGITNADVKQILDQFLTGVKGTSCQ
jgi:hypothetical protein